MDNPRKAQANVIERHHSPEPLMHRHIHIYIHKTGTMATLSLALDFYLEMGHSKFGTLLIQLFTVSHT